VAVEQVEFRLEDIHGHGFVLSPAGKVTRF
jgi:hypothetical protein